MKLRHRVLLFLGVTVVCLLTGIYFLSSAVLQRSYAKLEYQGTEKNIDRANRAFFQLVGDLHEKSIDWADWNDSYLFMANRNQGYIDSNLEDSAVMAMHLDVILYVDTQGHIFHSKTVKRLEKLSPPSPEAVLHALKLDRPLSELSESKEGYSGVIQYPGCPLLISVRAIHPTKHTGPSRGWLVFGRYFDSNALQNLSERTRLEVHLDNLGAANLPPHTQYALTMLSDANPLFIKPLDSHTIAGYTLLRDVHQHPIQVLSVSLPRNLYLQGMASITYFLRLIVVGLLLFSVTILLALEFYVLSRLSKLTAQVDRIGDFEQELASVHLPGKDEFTWLAEHINAMLAKLHQNAQSLRESEEQLRSYNENLEHTILQRSEELVHQAFHDTLTGLPNRALFMDRLAHAQTRRTRQPAPVAVLFLDLDNFKAINDSLGHDAGDQLLLSVAQRLEQCIRPGDTVAHLGGDEFTVLLDDLSSVEDAIAIAERIVETLRVPVKLSKSEVFASCSLGIAYATEASEQPDGLLRDADTAMYQAKASGKCGYTLFEAGMNDRALERIELERGLRLALENHELRVHYQPLIDLETGHLSGVEALVRWQHPRDGLIPPGKFIPIAEDLGLIIPIGYWVLEEACRQAKEWKAAYPDHGSFTVNVNLSGKQLQRADVVERVREILAKTELPPASLKIEITESVIMADMEDAVTKLNQLKTLGVKLAMDDFGTGYSSMASLSVFPLDTVKIDRAFISRMTDQQEAASVVGAIIMLSKALSLDVTGEGIETEEQVIALQGMGCNIGQGFYFAKPLTASLLGESMSTGGNVSMKNRDVVEQELIESLLRAA